MGWPGVVACAAREFGQLVEDLAGPPSNWVACVHLNLAPRRECL